MEEEDSESCGMNFSTNANTIVLRGASLEEVVANAQSKVSWHWMHAHMECCYNSYVYGWHRVVQQKLLAEVVRAHRTRLPEVRMGKRSQAREFGGMKETSFWMNLMTVTCGLVVSSILMGFGKGGGGGGGGGGVGDWGILH